MVARWSNDSGHRGTGTRSDEKPLWNRGRGTEHRPTATPPALRRRYYAWRRTPQYCLVGHEIPDRPGILSLSARLHIERQAATVLGGLVEG